MYRFWNLLTLFWEILLFIPILILIFFLNQKNIIDFWILKQLTDFFYSNILHYFFTEKQVFIWLMLWFCLLFQEIIWWSIKYFFFKPRPNPMNYSNWFEKVEAGSFPSLHSARTFLIFLFSFFWTNIFVSFLFFIFWLLISYSRIYLKKHYYIDILGWLILASLLYFSLYSIIF